MANRIVGVDIGSVSLRAIEVEGSKRSKPTVTRYHEVPLPEGSVKRGEVIEANTVASAFKRLWATGGFQTKDVVLGIGGQAVISRDLAVPRMPLAQIRESLPYQAQDLLPLPVSDAVLDFYPIAEQNVEGADLVRGLLVAAVKQAVLTNVNAAIAAGLNPVDVDLIPFALSRTVARMADTSELVAQVNVGANTTNILITQNGVPQFVRIVPAGGDDTTRALMTHLSLSRADAEQTKRRFGLGTSAAPDERRALEVIYMATNELLLSIRNTLAYYTSHTSSGLARVVLFGGGSRMIGFSDALSELTEAPVVSGNPFADVSLAARVKKRIDPDDFDAMSLAFGLALGSAA